MKLGSIPFHRLIIHNWHKFLPMEFIAYAKYFHGGKQDKDKAPFMMAWNHHVKLGKNHWEHWLLNPNYNFSTAVDGKLPMPPKYVREMVADWMGASRTKTNSWDMTDWLEKTIPEIKYDFHPKTCLALEKILCDELKYENVRIDLQYYKIPIGKNTNETN